MSDKTEGVPYPVAAFVTLFLLGVTIICIVTDKIERRAAAQRIVSRFPEVRTICDSPLSREQKAAAVLQLMGEFKEDR